MNKFQLALRNGIKPLVFGVVHLDALPGTPRYKKSLDQIAEKAIREARILKEEGVDGIIVENMGDVPYVRPHQSGPEIVACMARLALDVQRSIRNSQDLVWGISFLAACNTEAVAVAHACGFDFIRAEGFVFSHVADEGFIDGCAGSLLRYRRRIGAENISILTDVKKKHGAHAITADVSLSRTIGAAEFFLTDGIIITGTETGSAPSVKDVRDAKLASRHTPILVGSGLTWENVHEFTPYTDAFIVGSDLKTDGRWENDIERDRVRRFMKSTKM